MTQLIMAILATSASLTVYWLLVRHIARKCSPGWVATWAVAVLIITALMDHYK